MTQQASTLTFRTGDFVTERAARRARHQLERADARSAHEPRSATGRPTLLRRWSVAELIAQAAARPRRPAAL